MMGGSNFFCGLFFFGGGPTFFSGGVLIFFCLAVTNYFFWKRSKIKFLGEGSNFFLEAVKKNYWKEVKIKLWVVQNIVFEREFNFFCGLGVKHPDTHRWTFLLYD